MSRPYSVARAIVRLTLLIGWALLMPLVYLVAKLFGYAKLSTVPMWFHQGCCRILPMNISTSGKISTKPSTLFVCNHISYLDIFPLGSYLPGFFIAKSEVAHWPLIGQLARFQNTLFFERSGKQALTQIQVMKEHLEQGGNLILFPEGTSTSGEEVMPFKSTLFQAAELKQGSSVTIQPITITYSKINQQLMTQDLRDYFAWYGTMPFVSHILKMAGMPTATVELILHKPVKLDEFHSRKACALHCSQQVSRGLTEALN